MSIFQNIITDLDHVTSIEWIRKTKAPEDNYLCFSDNLHLSLYHYSYPVVTMYLSHDDWFKVSMHDSYSYVSHPGHKNEIFLENDITDELFFQQSLIVDFGWLDTDLFRRCVKFGKEYMYFHGYKSWMI